MSTGGILAALGAATAFALFQLVNGRVLARIDVARGTRWLLITGTVVLGAATRNGFQSMVDYTAPVFWSFLLLVGISLMVLRHKEPHHVLPFRVPLYPLTPLAFCASCLFMLHSSLVYTGVGALIGLAVIAAGIPLVLIARRAEGPAPAE